MRLEGPRSIDVQRHPLEAGGLCSWGLGLGFRIQGLEVESLESLEFFWVIGVMGVVGAF